MEIIYWKKFWGDILWYKYWFESGFTWYEKRYRKNIKNILKDKLIEDKKGKIKVGSVFLFKKI